MRGVGIAASVAVIATTLFDTLMSVWPAVSRSMAVRAQATDNPELLNRAALIEGLVALPMLVCYLAAIPLVVIWCYRARKNLDAFDMQPRMRAGWAIGGWFVPFANLVIPCRVMAEIARGSLARASTPVLVGIWWAGWLVYGVAGQAASRIEAGRYDRLPSELSSPADYQRYVDHYSASFRGYLPSVAGGIVAAITLLILIKRISTAQTDRIRAGQPAGPILPGTPMPPPVAPGAGSGTIGA